ncbi:F0F1 ATP synthase subunit alpha [Acuticoccus sediminis]|uniref:F0F1 ATP synthase subunit alpha n=1 Tax=Acuticoccus sediminis TaxID=2184697 RepID=UPI001CFE86EF|nr:F0F1 ATP synthase subunit alpha [Acuticoccus sediminis]
MSDATQLDAWLDTARAKVEAADIGASAEEVGRVESAADGVAFVSGLPGVRLDELVRFERGGVGYVSSLNADTVACVLLDDAAGVLAGDRVTGSGEVVRVPTGPALLGRVVDPLGRPLDGGPPIDGEAQEPVERPAPPIQARDFVTEPVKTGLLVVDAMFALGRGQRELIVGDRAIGKTAVGVDAIINQKNTDIISVYVAVGQKSSTVARVIEAIRRHGAPERTIIVVASPSSALGLQWIAPFAAATMAEHFRDRGQHALIVIDDLTKHAATHREIALITRQPPGREAYPGDVFYVHARLLERAAKLSKEHGGGSLTALPIAELDAGNLSAYIPTNLISITDGQIVLDSALFQAGQKPAVDVGRSVSRVGGKTQAPALRKAASMLRLDYAQFLEIEMFTRFGGVTDAKVKDRIARGRRIRAVLSQDQYAPFRLVDEVAMVLAVQGGVLDPLPVDKVPAFRTGLPAALDRAAGGVVESVEATGTLDDAGRETLLSAMTALVADLTRSTSEPSAPEPAGAADGG